MIEMDKRLQLKISFLSKHPCFYLIHNMGCVAQKINLGDYKHVSSVYITE